jgi:hypothetical protein
MEWFAGFLVRQGIQRFEDVCKKDIDIFLSHYSNSNTKNLYIQVFRSFYDDLNGFRGFVSFEKREA